MSQKDKLMQRIKNNPKDIEFEELHQYLIANGAEWREGKGSHCYYILKGETLAVPRQKPLKAYLVKRAIAMVEGKD